jgi:GH25 family lysozyme M1 (1,4-beta-N-acetylmuramidase)
MKHGAVLAALVVLELSACGGTDLGSHAEEVKVCPGGDTVEGIDVSVYQGTIDWHKVAAAGVEFSFIRAAYGISHVDSKFAGNWSGARAAGVLRGAYHFFREDEDPVMQADLFLDTMGPLEDDDLPPAIDVETADGQSAATIVANVGAWIGRVKQATGRTPVIYSGKYFWNGNVGASAAFLDEALWIPQWGVTCPDLPNPWTAWRFWQYSDTGRVDGISGAVDRDRFNGDGAALRSYIGVPAAPRFDAPPGSPDARPPITRSPDAGSSVGAIPVGLTGGCAVGGRGSFGGGWIVALALLVLGRRRDVLRGAILTLPATDASRRLADRVHALVQRFLGDDFASLVALRRRLAADPSIAALAAAMLRGYGCRPGTRVDAVRLRAVRSGGHQDPAAAPVYAAHRDTWFANPAAQINWWLPLADVGADSTFAIYPRYFSRPIANSSAGFDLAALEAAGGFGAGAAAAALHPAALEPVDPGGEVRVVCRRAEVVVFAGAHLHRTLPQDSGRTRLSIDVRTVDPADVGPPAVDNRSRGEARYLPLSSG